MNKDNDRIEKMSAKELMKLFKKYAESYTPEWNPDFNSPDIGLTIGIIFVNQMEDNIKRYRELLDRYYFEFIDILKLTLNPPKPAKAVVMIKLMSNTVPGLLLAEKTKFIASREDENIVFESVNSVYITEAVIDTVMISDTNNRWKLIAGKFMLPDINKSGYREVNLNEINSINAFCIKHSETDNQLVVWHDFVFTGTDDRVIINIDDSFANQLRNKKLGLYFICNEKKIPISDYIIMQDSVEFEASKDNIAGICISEENEVDENVSLKKFEIRAFGKSREADYVYNDIKDCKINNFEPFGDTLTLYSQCVIGCNSCFSKKKSRIAIEFDLNFGENLVGQIRKRDDNLKVIKRRNYYDDQPVADTYVSEIIFEYDTGRGYRTLELEEDYSKIFYEGEEGHKQITFICPEEWAENEESSYKGRTMRMRILKADNCYIQPCIHHYPIISNLKLSYIYADEFLVPDKIEKHEGLSKKDITKDIASGIEKVIFSTKSNDEEKSMYIGFDKALFGGPISMLITMDESIIAKQSNSIFFYYSKSGWKRLKVVDNTDDFTHSGTILFYPPGDMVVNKDFGQERYYILIKGKDNGGIINNISFNGVEVHNVDTGEEEDYYIQTEEANMTVSIDCKKLLTIDLWVNETKEHSRSEMLKMKDETPEKIRIEYDYFGEITAFYVKWTEVDNIFLTDVKRAYILDRNRELLCFGDGVHSMIPKNTTDVAFKIIPYYCNGQDGNIKAESIDEMAANIIYVDEVTNPLDAFGGSGMEKYNKLLERGSETISSHRRLVTENDYVHAVMGYSDIIHMAKCISKDGKIFISILTKDYKKGSSSFNKIKNELQEYLLERSEITIKKDLLNIVEPLFVAVNVTVWIKLSGDVDTFAISSKIKDRLGEFLDSVTGKSGNGWEMGILPRQSQLIMEINSLQDKFTVKNILITGTYRDEKGLHECDLEKLKNYPFVVIRNGKHQIYTE